MKTVSVIIVTHNHAKYLNQCLHSLVPEVDQVNGEIIVIDNRSNDESTRIARRYPQVRLHVNERRQGFAANSNFGMAIAQGRYLLLLNPDTETMPGALQQLIDFMDEHPNVGMCGAQLVFPTGAIQPSPRRFPTLGSFMARRTPLRPWLQNSASNKRHLMLEMDHTQPQAVDWLLGACLFVRRETIGDVGPLDEGFFLYVEDIDWAYRMHQHNWLVYYVPTASIIHHHLAVSDHKLLSYRTYLHTKSMLRYVRKHMLGKSWLAIHTNESQTWQRARSQGALVDAQPQ